MKIFREFERTLSLTVLIAATVVSTAFAQAPLGNALSFNGVNQYVTVTNFGSITPTNEITVEFWANTRTFAGQSAFQLSPDSGANRLNAHLNYGTSYADALTYWDFGNISGSGRLSTACPPNSISNWVHYALVASQSGNYMSIYTNGVLQISKANMTPFVRGTYNLQIAGPNFPYNGSVDEFRVWSVARSAAQIQASLNTPLVGNETNLVLYYKFDGASGTIATNSAIATGPVVNGILTNNPAWVASGAATRAVTNNSDSGPGSLRQTVASATPGTTITFAPNLSGQIILLTNGKIVLSNNVTIDASALNGGITISGNNISRVFDINPGVTNTLNGLIISGGFASGPFPDSYGGGIQNQGVLALTNCTMTENSGFAGGAIYNRSGRIALNNCTLSGNSAQFGGGIQNEAPCVANSSTFAGNTASQQGGAISAPFSQPVTLNQCTLVGNSAAEGGGIRIGGSGTAIFNTIIAGNTASSSPDIYGTFTATGGNLTNVNPQLAVLGNYGGPTPTMPPLPGSPAIDNGNDTATNTFATDQRGAGFPRLLGAHVDIGAAEFVPMPAVVTLPAVNLTMDAATLRGAVNPNNVVANYYFQYGTTTNYSTVTTPNNLPAVGSNITVSAALSGLLPAALYHFRVVAANSGGTNYGADQTALLASCYSPAISSEMVLPATLPDLHLAGAGTINAMVMQPDGKIIIGGYFTAVNDVPCTSLIRLNPNGSVDLTWNPPALTYNVNAMALDGTNLYIGGNFSSAFGNMLLKLSTVTGAPDPQWNPQNIDIEVDALAVLGTNLYVGGQFTTFLGAARNGLARLSKTGPMVVDPNWNPAPNGQIYSLLAINTNLFAGGFFTNIGGQARRGVAKLATVGAGAADALWNPGIISGGTNFDTRIAALASDGTNLFVGGGFVGIGANTTQAKAAKVSTTGTGAVFSDWTPNPNDFVYSLAVTNGNIFIAGLFSTIGGQLHQGIAKVSAGSGAAVDANWHPTPSPFFSMRTVLATDSSVLAGGIFNTIDGTVSLSLAQLDPLTGARDPAFPTQVKQQGRVQAMVQQADGKIIVGGSFYYADSLPRQNILRLNQDGSLDANWRPNVNGAVNAMLLNGGDLFIGGTFTRVSGATNYLVAKLLTSSLDAVNVVNTSWQPPANPTTPADNQVVYAMVMAGSNIVVAGSISGLFNLGNIVQLSAYGSGAVVGGWSPNPNGPVNSILAAGTNLFAGGSFGTIGGANRNSLARLFLGGSGTADTAWNANLPVNANIRALAADGTNLFLAGDFTSVGGVNCVNLGKMALNGSGLVDTNWSGNKVNPYFLTSLAINGPYLYVGGFVYLARYATTGAGLVDPAWNTTIGGVGGADILSLLPRGNAIYAGGDYSSFGPVGHNSFALVPIPGAPALFQDAATNLYIVPNLSDGPEITYFYVSAIYGGTLFHKDGVTPINCGDFISANEAGAGLPFNLGGTVTVAPATDNTLDNVGGATASYTMVTNPVPFVALSAAAYSVQEGNGNVAVTVKKFGIGSALVDYATADVTAQAGVRYQANSARLSFAATETSKTIFIPIADDFAAEPDQSFTFTLAAVPGATNSQLASPSQALVTIIDNDFSGSSASVLTNQAVSAVPVANGVLSVNLQPPAAFGQWRLVGQLDWQNSDARVSGLVAGNYVLEFHPVNGYFQPANITVPIDGGVPGNVKTTNQFTYYYTSTTNLDAGNLTATIQPGDVATNSNTSLRGQWRRQGDATWHDSSDVIPGLPAGNYTVEYKPVTGKLTPTPQTVQVGGGNANYGYTATYLVAPAAPGALTPVVVPFATATGNAPYLYNGQLQTSVGFASGVVVKPRVVLTVAHAMFDDTLLAYVTSANWFFERYRDQLEPAPQVPRGWYIFDGYAAQRTIDNSPDISTPASQNLDAAALYFLADAGRGGYGGYLAADPGQSELLTDNNKMLAGYPLDGVDPTNQGKLFATVPADVIFTRLYTGVFSTTNIQSYPGNSGGSMYVQDYSGTYYPAGIFLGGSGQTLVRGIDSGVVDLINRADTSGNGGGNSTGGGVSTLNPGLNATAFGAGLLIVNATPNLANFTPGWRIKGGTDTNYVTGLSTTTSLIGGGGYPIEFKPVPGFLTPSNRTVQVAVNQTTTIQASYVPMLPLLKFQSLTSLTITGGIGATYRVEVSTNLGSAAWSPLLTQKLASSSITITNLGPATNRVRFFRAVLLP